MRALRHEEMRIFKVRKRSEKSRRYVITRIYGFFVFSEICTFVQCGVRRNNIRRIFCRCVLKYTCEKIVRQCDRKTLLYYGFPVDSCYSGKFLLLPVLFWLCPKLEILSFPKKQCDNATAVLPYAVLSQHWSSSQSISINARGCKSGLKRILDTGSL